MKRFIFGLAVVLWAAMVIAAYYAFHKHWDNDQLWVLLTVARDFIVAAGLAGLAGGIGRRVSGTVKGAHPLERIALNAAVGLGLMGLMVLAAGLLGLLAPWMAWTALGVGMLGFRRHIIAWLVDWRILGAEFRDAEMLGKLAAGFVVLVLGIQLSYALAPPLKWDSLVYHLELPRRYLAAGRVVFTADNLNVGMPQLAEMSFTWAMALGSERAAATLGWVVGLITSAGVAGFSRKHLPPDAVWLAPAILLTGESISGALSWAYVDLWVMLFGLGLVVSLDAYRRTRARVWMLTAGLLLGFAMGTKYTAGILLPVGISLLFMHRFWGEKDSGKSVDTEPAGKKWMGLIQEGAVLAAVALIVFLPWALKNLDQTGNPVYPFVFPGRALDSLRLSFYQGGGAERTLRDDLLLPLEATILGIEGKEGYNTSIGPLLLGLIPGVIIGWREMLPDRRERLKQYLIIAGLSWLMWATGSRLADALSRTRHYFGVFPIFAALATAGYHQVSQVRFSEIRLGRILSALILLVFFFSATAEVRNLARTNPLPVLMGEQDEFDYLSQSLGWYGPAMEAINDLPAGSKVAFLWEARPLYCRDVDCRPDVILDQWWYLHHKYGDPEKIAAYLHTEGVTHVLIYELGARFVREQDETWSLFKASDWEALDKFTSSELEKEQDFGETYALYKLSTDE